MTNPEVVGADADPDPAVLPISEVSRRTGIPVAGLRNWEQRYGLPRPQRLANGQLWVNPDCGLKTRKWEEVKPALINMVEAARIARATI